jgi:predicted nuclease of restriction endonuclease-like (RecB) superfamily
MAVKKTKKTIAVKKLPVKKRSSVEKHSKALYVKIIKLIEQSRNKVYKTVNTELTLLNWQIGYLINHSILQETRANYGEQIVATLSQQLTKKFGTGYTFTSLTRMINFSKEFTNLKIVATLSQQLSWSHFVDLIGLTDDVKRNFYIQNCLHEHWSVRTMRERIDSMLFERTAISKKPALLLKKELALTKKDLTRNPDIVFRDPYIFDFLGLQNAFSETDLESSILLQLQQFIVELGTDFAFLARQKRITIDGEDFYIDLLFYHRGLQRLVALDLKLGKFKAAYKGQMELYLRWLQKNESRVGEKSPLGLILCSEKSQEQIELLQLDKGQIRVAQYITQLPPKKLLEEKLHKAIEIAQNNLIKNSTNKK